MFSDLLIQSIKNTNSSFEEDGIYKGYSVTKLVNGDYLFQNMDLDQMSKVDSVIIHNSDWTELERRYLKAYEEDGGDGEEEYETLANWPFQFDIISKMGTELNTIC